MIFVNIDLDTGFTAPVPCVSAKWAWRIMNIFSCTAHAIQNCRKDLLDRVSNIVDKGLESLTSIDLCNLLLYGNYKFPFDTNHSIIESTITFIKSAKHLNKFSLISFTNTSRHSRLYLHFFPRICFCIVNIRAVCYLEQQRLDRLCHSSAALDIVRSYYVHFIT